MLFTWQNETHGQTLFFNFEYDFSLSIQIILALTITSYLSSITKIKWQKTLITYLRRIFFFNCEVSTGKKRKWYVIYMIYVFYTSIENFHLESGLVETKSWSVSLVLLSNLVFDYSWTLGLILSFLIGILQWIWKNGNKIYWVTNFVGSSILLFGLSITLGFLCYYFHRIYIDILP